MPRFGRGWLVCLIAGPQAPWASWASHDDPFGAVGTLACPGRVLVLGATPAPQPAKARARLNLLAGEEVSSSVERQRLLHSAVGAEQSPRVALSRYRLR